MVPASIHLTRGTNLRRTTGNGRLDAPGNPQRRFQSAPGKIAQAHRPAVRLRDVARDRQAEAAAAGIAVARTFDAIERLEYPLDIVLRYAGPVIADRDIERAILFTQRNVRAAAVGECVVDQILQAALERLRPAHHRAARVTGYGDSMTGLLRVLLQAGDQRRDVDRLDRFAAFGQSTHVIQRRGHHLLQFVEILDEL